MREKGINIQIFSEIASSGQYATTESDAWPLIPEEVSREVINGVAEGSSTLKLFRRLPNMSSRTMRLPVLNALGSAEFTGTTTNDNLVAGADSVSSGSVANEGIPGLKATHQFEWDKVFVVAEPLAIILPIGEDVLEDSAYPIWDEVRPRIIEAFGQKIDSAVIWGQGRPTTWPSGIVPTAINRGFSYAEGTGADLGEDTSELMGLLEAVGYDPSGWILDPTVKKDLRNLRDNVGKALYYPGLVGGEPASLYGIPLSYVKNATFLPQTARFIVGDMDKAVYSIRSDMRFKIFTEGVITDSDGKVIMNLMQNDMVALRVVMRMGWAIPNPIHALASRATRYPFAVMTA